MRLFGFLLVSALAAGATEQCEPDYINTLPAESSDRRAVLEDRLQQTPDDFTLNRLFLSASVYGRSPIRERYQRLFAAHPDSLDYQYLRARSLVGSNTKEALRIYGQILDKDPDYPWVHLSQLEIYRSPVFRDRQKLQASFSVMTRVCPAMFAPYGYLNEIPDNALAAHAAQFLRAMLRALQSPRQLAYYRNLWAVEFRLLPAAEHNQERKQIAEDLMQLLPFEHDPLIRPVIKNGAELDGDDALAKRMAAEPQADPIRLVNDASNAWFKKYPAPKNDDPPEKKQAYGADLLAKSDEWRKMAPKSVIGYYHRVKALTLVNASEREIAAAGEEMLAMLRGSDPSSSTWFVNLARVYVDNGILLDRVPGIVSEAIERLDDPEAVVEIDLSPDRALTAQNREMLVYYHDAALLVLAEADEKQGQRDKAHETLYQATEYLASKAPSPTETNEMVLFWYKRARYENLRTQAEMAEREGRKLDALNGYRETLSVLALGQQKELMARQRKLWQELGGSDEGWQQWMDQALAATPKTARTRVRDRPEYSAENRKLPPLLAQDTEGRQWTLDRLAGKTTIAVVWATWCVPCRAELPYFAKLADRLKNSDLALAIAFNTDDNIALAESFAKSHGYTFPVLGAKQYAEDLMPLMSIPRTWISRNGVIAEEHIGFGDDGDKWVEQLLSQLKEP